MLEIWRTGHRHVLDADISGFFDNLPHAVVMRGLSDVVADGNILRLVQRFLTAGVRENGVVQSTTLGTPQGGVLSPWLANIALNFLDWHLDELGLHFVRYADDFVVLCRTARQAKEARTQIEQFRELDEWFRMRLRSMRLKRKNRLSPCPMRPGAPRPSRRPPRTDRSVPAPAS